MEKLLTVSDVAEILQCHPQTVYRNRELPYCKISGVGKRFKESEIEKYLEVKTQKPIQEIIENKRNTLINPPDYGNISISGGYSEMAKAKSKSRINFGYGAIYQRKTKKGKIRWYIDYKDAYGKRIQRVARSAISKEEATLALQKEVSLAFDRRYGTSRRKEPIHFEDFVELYMNNYAKPKKKSWRSDSSYLNAHAVPFFKGSLLSEIRIEMIEKYIGSRLKEKAQKSSINRELACLRKLFNKAIDWDYIQENPVSRVKFFSEKNNFKERVLTQDEEERLMQECPPYLIPIIIMALQTGMRKGEILGLTWNDINLEKREICIKHSKNGKIRYIPINDILFPRLLRMKNKKSESEFVFLNANTGKPLTDVKKSFKSACVRSNISNLRFHDLRHTFASRLVEQGVDLITVKDLLGHSSVRITERYTHSNKTLKQKAVKKLQTTPEKSEDLLHICGMEKNLTASAPISDTYSIN